MEEKYGTKIVEVEKDKHEIREEGRKNGIIIGMLVSFVLYEAIKELLESGMTGMFVQIVVYGGILTVLVIVLLKMTENDNKEKEIVYKKE